HGNAEVVTPRDCLGEWKRSVEWRQLIHPTAVDLLQDQDIRHFTVDQSDQAGGSPVAGEDVGEQKSEPARTSRRWNAWPTGVPRKDGGAVEDNTQQADENTLPVSQE